MDTTLGSLKEWKKDELGFYKLMLENGYEVTLEPLLFDEQWYLAIYKDKNLVTPKVVVKVGN